MTQDATLPQLTVKAIVLGIVLSMVLAGANAYLGLFAGMTVSASIPAAVISMGILRLFKESNILENNIVQTSASAGESLAAGVIFTLPALIILGYWQVFEYWWVCVIAGIGGLLGVLFTVPLRRSLIVEQQLKFPEGTATAEVLKVGDDPGKGVKYLGLAALTGGLVKFAETGLKVWPGVAQSATYAGQSGIAYVGTNLSPALLSVGFIVGLNIATLVFVGGCISWYVAIPIYGSYFLDSDPALLAAFESGASATDLAFAIWTSKIRYLGVGAMLVGGIWALISMRDSLVSGIASGLHQYRRIAVFVIPLYVLYQQIVGGVSIALVMTLIMVVTGFLFSAVAAYMAGLVGSSNNPISGITIATILFSSLLLLWLMGDVDVGPAAALLIGAVVCCAAAIAGDNLQDLKAGYIVGATPWKQQVMQGVGVVSAVLVMAPILNLLLEAYGIGVPTAAKPGSLLAPQATLMASVAQGVFKGGLPWGMVAIGAAIGAVIIGVDEWLKARGSNVQAPVLAVAVGIYLPLELSVPIFAGGLIAHFAGRDAASDARSLRHGMLFAAGLITGPIVLTGDAEVFAVPEGIRQGGLVGLLAIAAVAFALYRVAVSRRTD
jgi:uncharacterized oligopeptide transporter (OPT) family protein